MLITLNSLPTSLPIFLLLYYCSCAILIHSIVCLDNQTISHSLKSRQNQEELNFTLLLQYVMFQRNFTLQCHVSFPIFKAAASQLQKQMDMLLISVAQLQLYAVHDQPHPKATLVQFFNITLKNWGMRQSIQDLSYITVLTLSVYIHALLLIIIKTPAMLFLFPCLDSTLLIFLSSWGTTFAQMNIIILQLMIMRAHYYGMHTNELVMILMKHNSDAYYSGIILLLHLQCSQMCSCYNIIETQYYINISSK